MKKFTSISVYHILPVSLILIINALIVRMKAVELTDKVSMVWTTQNINYDFFSYYKSKVLLVLTIFSCLMFFVNKEKKKVFIKKNIINIISLLFVISVTISTFTSIDVKTSLIGAPDRYEGYFVILCYIFLMLISFNVADKSEKVNIIIVSLAIGSIFVSIIGILQFIGFDIFNTQIGKKIILPREYWTYINNLKFKFANQKAYATLYNPNYVGSYTAITVPLFLMLFLGLDKIKTKLFYGILFLLNLALLISSTSRAGYLAIIVNLILVVIFNRKKLLSNKKILIVMISSFVLLTALLNYVTNGIVLDRINLLVKDLKNIFSNYEYKVDSNIPNDAQAIDNSLIIYYKDEIIKFKFENSKLDIYDKNNNRIDFEIDSNTGDIKFKEKRLYNKKYAYGYLNGMPVIQFKTYSNPINFIFTQDGFKFLGMNNYLYTVEKIEKINFGGKEKLGSARLYNWSRSIPLIKKHPFFGYGTDVFLLAFPQNDIFGKLTYLGHPYNTLEDKPHNMYIQMAVNNGLITLGIFLFLVGLFIKQSINIYFCENDKEDGFLLGNAIFIGVIGYLITGFFNDSVVSVAPIFWILIGAGFSINNYFTQSNKSKFRMRGKHCEYI